MKPEDQARRLLESLGDPDPTATSLARSEMPVQALVERLRAPDGEAWFATLMASDLFASFGPAARELIAPDVDLARLAALKDEGKRRFKEATPKDVERRSQGLAAHVLAVAAALCHHGRSISKVGRDQLDPAFLELATAVPEPWSSLLSRAAFVGRE